MDEHQVGEIFFKHWADTDSLDTALMAARKEITEEILADLFSDQVIDRERWKLILEVNDAHGRTGYFIPYPKFEVNTSRPQSFKHLAFIYRTWEKSMKYIVDNYDSIESEDFKEKNPLSDFEGLVKKIFEDIDSGTAEFQSTGSIIIQRTQFLLIEKIFEMTLHYVLLGKEIYNQYARETTKCLNALKRFRQEMHNQKSTKMN